MTLIRTFAVTFPFLLALGVSGCGASDFNDYDSDYDTADAQFEEQDVPLAAPTSLDSGNVNYCGLASMPLVVGSDLKMHGSPIPHRITGTVNTTGGKLELDANISVSIFDLKHLTVKSGTSTFKGNTTQLKESKLDMVVQGTSVQSLKGTVKTACNAGIFLDVKFKE